LTDTTEANKKFQKELNAGTASLVLLSILARAEEPMYGYRIAKLMESGAESAPMMKQGALYPVLRSLESNGLLESYVDPSISGPPRRYYRITDLGLATQKSWSTIWDQTKTFVESVLKGKNDV
jgi:PadR family transcriptional regulator PadR